MKVKSIILLLLLAGLVLAACSCSDNDRGQVVSSTPEEALVMYDLKYIGV